MQKELNEKSQGFDSSYVYYVLCILLLIQVRSIITSTSHEYNVLWNYTALVLSPLEKASISRSCTVCQLSVNWLTSIIQQLQHYNDFVVFSIRHTTHLAWSRLIGNWPLKHITSFICSVGIDGKENVTCFRNTFRHHFVWASMRVCLRRCIFSLYVVYDFFSDRNLMLNYTDNEFEECNVQYSCWETFVLILIKADILRN